MIVLDITKYLQKAYPNLYIFNPSMIHIAADLYLVAYRVCKYNLTREFHNPWKVWDNGYKVFSGPAKAKKDKLRTAELLEPGFSIELSSSARITDYSVDEYDSTSIALIRMGDEPDVRYNLECPFGNRMNQDARLFVECDTMYIVYNIYYTDGSVVLLKRTVELDLDAAALSFGPEEYMFNHCYKTVEKNCSSSHTKGHVLYAIGDTLDVLANGRFIKKPCPLKDLIKYYGEKNVHCSLSTPTIQYGDKFISCGHVKFLYKQIKKEPFSTFLSNFKFININSEGNIYPHGKYIYFAFFFEFDKEYNITRLSNLFIPSIVSCHIPYLLVMPTGFTRVGENICMSYGEGDKKCKLLILTNDEMEQVLDRFGGADFVKPCLLTQDLHIQHVGYFGFHNTGDDAFVKIFEYLRDKYYSGATIEFLKPRQKSLYETNLTILGGGDVLTTYFLNHPYQENSIAVGVGIPYKEFEKEAAKFKSCIIRNVKDCEGARPFNSNVFYYPDICFLLPKIYPQQIRPIVSRIGVSIMRTYFNPSCPEIYNDYVKQTASWITIFLSRHLKETIWLIPFGINRLKEKEDDMIAARDIFDAIEPDVQKRVSILQVTQNDNVGFIFNFIKSLSFMICARFHSHIFSMAANIPFVSLTCGHKCITFMEQNKLSEYLYVLSKNELDMPLPFDAQSIADFIAKSWAKKESIKKKVLTLNVWHARQMELFEKEYIEILRGAASPGKLKLV
jgi:tRNA threonylcarbamoyladenosine modification (KEOPS) complex Cgi121 subunit